MIRIAGVSIAMIICSIVLKQYNRTFAVILSVGGALILFAFLADNISDIISQLNDISSSVSGAYSYIRLMLRILGTILVSQLVSDVCRDNGENAIATMVETGSKIIVIAMIIPLFNTIITAVTGLLK